MQNDDQKRINGNEKRHLGYWRLENFVSNKRKNEKGEILQPVRV
jgi:hypothetical protein